MNMLNPEAEAHNNKIKSANESVYQLLSRKGKAIYYPNKGVLKQGAEAKGKKINATIGMALEDDGSPMRLPSIADSVGLPPNTVFPYASSFGSPDLREKWKQRILDKNPSLKGDFSLPIVTVGLTNALSTAAYMFIDPGEKIILTDIFWGNYKLIFQHAYDAEFDPFTAFRDRGFNVEGLREKLAPRTGKHIILLNFPNNPTGYTPSYDEAERIAEVIHESAEAGNNILVILDDAYFGLVYKEGIIKESIFAWLANIHPRVLTVKIDGATKEDYAWGLRVGFITYAATGCSADAYPALENKTAGTVRGQVSSAPNISQSLLLKALESETYLEEKKQKYQLLKARFDEVQRVLEANKEKYSEYFTPLPYNSGYFMCVKLTEGLDPEKIRQLLLNEYSTGIVATTDMIRVAFSSAPKKDIAALFEYIYEACGRIKKGQ